MTIDLTLNVTDNNTVTWQVWLDGQEDANIVKDWGGASPNYTKDSPSYSTNKNVVDIYITCTGYGANAVCEVVVNGTSKGSVTAQFDDANPAHKAFQIP